MSEIRIKLQQVTETILDNMQAHGWYSGASSQPRFDRPQPWNINDGNCEDWALLAVAMVGGEECWLDTFKTTADWAHCVLRLNGKYYDSLHLDGCRTLKQFIAEANVAAENYREFEAQRFQQRKAA